MYELKSAPKESEPAFSIPIILNNKRNDIDIQNLIRPLLIHLRLCRILNRRKQVSTTALTTRLHRTNPEHASLVSHSCYLNSKDVTNDQKQSLMKTDYSPQCRASSS
jgi:hypothetical protein